MQVNQIRYFLVLYEERNFIRAARRCGVSQPLVTNAIKRLQRTFGSPLFERTSRNPEPTEFGQVVRPYLEQISKYAEEAKRKAENSLHS
jgi:DNA-binding transcriptional LysR family regulator